MITSSPKKLVSIITPVYNDGRYISACANSVLLQSLPDFEWLLIDDGSDIETATILANLAASDPRVSVLTNPVSRGPAFARNVGVSAAQGRVCGFFGCGRYLGFGETRAANSIYAEK
ncbi:glycosyltransferase family 2 protein [Cupriavidus basilensis]